MTKTYQKLQNIIHFLFSLLFSDTINISQSQFLLCPLLPFVSYLHASLGLLFFHFHSEKNKQAIQRYQTNTAQQGAIKTRHKPLHQGWAGQSCRRKRAQEQLRVRDIPTLTISSPRKSANKTTKTYTHIFLTHIFLSGVITEWHVWNLKICSFSVLLH